MHAAAPRGPADGPPGGDRLLGTLVDGRYRVDALIATGGMSAVYRGVDVRLDRPVAVKIMDHRYAGDVQFLSRFRLEARSAARLRDTGVVAVYDQGVDGHQPFLVMELVEGGTLRELLAERGPMPPHAAAAVMRPVLGGLAAAHRHGLVHRDVKPENVLISDDGEVKLADFGLVRALAEAGMTSTGVILGTAAYLSPEQVATGAATPRSDVYAAGILLYELLTGVTPFAADTPLALAYRRLDGDVPPPSAAIAGVPAAFDDLVRVATAREPGDRHADAAVLAEDLDAVADELGLPPFRVPAPRHGAARAARDTGNPDARRHDTDGLGGGEPGFGDARAGDPDETGVVRPAGPPRPTRVWDREAPDDDGRWAPRTFAGIDLAVFAEARRRARRAAFVWCCLLLVVVAGVAAGAWSLGTHLDTLLPR